MTTIAMAWEAFRDAIAEVQALHASGADGTTIQDLLQHPRERLDAIADEISLNGISLPDWIRNGLEQMLERLIAAEGTLVTNH